VLGLWLGMSVLTIFEFVEFALDISVLAVVEIVLNVSSKRQMKRRRNRIAPAKQSAPPPPPPPAPGTAMGDRFNSASSPEPAKQPPASARSSRPATADQVVEPRHPNTPDYD